MTHLVAQRCGGEKYQYAMTFRVPIVAASWVHDAWAMRSQFDYSAAETGVVVSYHINFNKSHVLSYFKNISSLVLIQIDKRFCCDSLQFTKSNFVVSKQFSAK